MDVRVDETGCDESVTRVDLAINDAFEALADEDDAVVFVDELGVSPQHMATILVSD